MAAAIAHRGPDDEGFFEAVTRAGERRVGLAHRRLSIIDLVHRASTAWPTRTARCRSSSTARSTTFPELRDELIATGHAFRTRSDTETIVHAYEEWGPDCVTRFRGMFAFAIWDANRERLLLARDRYGKKPLFLYQADDLLLFASEIKAILAFPGVPRRVDRDGSVGLFRLPLCTRAGDAVAGHPQAHARKLSGVRARRGESKRHTSCPTIGKPATARPADSGSGVGLSRAAR